MVDTPQPAPVPPAAAPAATPAAETNQPAGMPDLSGASQGELAALLDKLNAPQGGEQQGGQGVPEVKPPEQTPAQGAQIPDKFKNPDGSVNTDALTKSYTEAERQMSQLFQERSALRNELQQTQQQIAEMRQRIDESSRKPQPEEQEEKQEYTEEEIEEMRSNPRSFIQKEVKKTLDSHLKEQKAEVELNQKIDQAINYGRANVEGFKSLEPEIAKVMESPAFARHPEAVQLGYYAVLGQKVPELVRQSKNMGFTEGYNKAKEEMTKHVESGGKSSLPAELGNMSEEQIRGMKPEELKKLVGTIDRSTGLDVII